MATITEDYVSFECAKLLKEKGFNEACNSYFISDNEIALISNRRDFNNHGVYLSAPTLQMAMKWLIEKHNLFITINYCVGAYVWSIADIFNGNVILKMDATVSSYEQAVEAAIKYCLENLI